MTDPDARARRVILAAQSNRDRERCVCGEIHEDGHGITPAVVARMRAYLAANPDHRFAADEDAGIIAVIIAKDPAAPGPPEILAWSRDLTALLDAIGAPPAADLS